VCFIFYNLSFIKHIMKEIHYGDIPRIPKGLNKLDPLKTDTSKRSGELKKVRHKIKEYLNILKIPFNQR